MVREEVSGGTAAARKSYGRGRGAGAAAPGVVDPSRGQQRGRGAGLAFACTLTCKSHGCMLCTPSKAISRHRQSGKDCPAIHPRLQWHRGYDLPSNPPAQGGRQVPHRVLHKELLGDRSDPCCVFRRIPKSTPCASYTSCRWASVVATCLSIIIYSGYASSLPQMC